MRSSDDEQGINKLRPYRELLNEDCSVVLYITEILEIWQLKYFKPKVVFCQDLLQEKFSRETLSHYNLRRLNSFKISAFRIVYPDCDIISLFRYKIWSILLTEIKQQISLKRCKK